MGWADARCAQFEDDGDELVVHIMRNTRRYVHLFSLAADNLMPAPSEAVRCLRHRGARLRARVGWGWGCT
jgi:hypothetical protein